MPKMKKGGNDGAWVEVPVEEGDTRAIAKGKKTKKVFRVLTFRGRQEQGWLDSNMWQPLQETVIPQTAKMPMIEVYYGTYGSDGMRRDGAPGGSYSAVYEQYRMQGGDVYTRDEARKLYQWDTRKPIPGFDPKLGSKTLDIYSED
jgi:hypothetical protein